MRRTAEGSFPSQTPPRGGTVLFDPAMSGRISNSVASLRFGPRCLQRYIATQALCELLDPAEVLEGFHSTMMAPSSSFSSAVKCVWNSLPRAAPTMLAVAFMTGLPVASVSPEDASALADTGAANLRAARPANGVLPAHAGDLFGRTVERSDPPRLIDGENTLVNRNQGSCRGMVRLARFSLPPFLAICKDALPLPLQFATHVLAKLGHLVGLA